MDIAFDALPETPNCRSLGAELRNLPQWDLVLQCRDRESSIESLTSFGGVGARLAFTLRSHILVDAFSYAGVAISLPISPTNWAVSQGAITVVNCSNKRTSINPLQMKILNIFRDTKTAGRNLPIAGLWRHRYTV